MKRDKDPYANYRFRLELGSITVAGFSECSGLNVEVKVFEYKEGGNNSTTLKFPEAATYANVVLKRGVTRDLDLINWQLDVVNGKFETNKRPQFPPDKNPPPPGPKKQSIAVLLLDEKGDEVRRWNLIRAFPVKWSGPEFKAVANEVGIEALELAHEGIQTGSA
ncbi:MAG: phage tail protein [Acidobacteriota bacterium]|nr:phage tail protein [Acidobacteriota bacterium]